MSLSTAEIVYVVAVLAVGGLVLAWTLALLRSSRKSHVKGVERRRRFEAVPTSTPIEDPKQVAIERGLESIDKHFSVMRRSLVPIVAAVTLLLAAIPLVSETSASIVAAVVAVLAGLAFRPFLENAMAGIVIGTSRLVRIGDTVRIDDWYGTVEDITATHTAVKVWDWRRYLVPNNRMLQSAFINYSLFDTYQWAYVEFWVAPTVDIEQVRELAIQAASRSRHFSRSEDPAFWVMGIEKDAIRCWVAAWADSPSEAWALNNDIRTDLLRSFRQLGIALSLQRHHWSAQEAPSAPSPVNESPTPTDPLALGTTAVGELDPDASRGNDRMQGTPENSA